MPIITNNNYNVSVTPNRTLLQGVIRSALVQGNITSTWNIKSGGQSKIVYKGTEQQVVAIALNAQQDGFEYTISGGHIWTIEITFPIDVNVNSFNNEPNPVTSWEISNTSIQQNILEAKDTYLTGILGPNVKKSIESNLKNADASKPPTGFTSQPEFVNAQITQNLKFAGVEGKLLFVPTLKRTIIVSNRYDPGWATNSNETVMTTPVLLTRYGTAAANNGNPLSALPEFLANTLPVNQILVTSNGTIYQEGFVPSNYIESDGIVTFVGWLEYPPEYQTISLNKIQISQQWIFNRWSAGGWGLYDAIDVNGNSIAGPDPTSKVLGTS